MSNTTIRPVVCPDCGGTEHEWEVCERCGGEGDISMNEVDGLYTSPTVFRLCSHCGGRGWFPFCAKCGRDL